MGGSSVVYEATHQTRGERVALKVFKTNPENSTWQPERMQREVEALKHLRHPNVVQLIQFWKIEDKTFLELELVHGKTLKDWMKSESQNQGWIEPNLWVLALVARALGAVHQEQILHRDLKPENILISMEGEVKLTDFGLAKSKLANPSLTKTGSLVGSLAYMAPEVVRGKIPTDASDIFSFGVVAYELLTGHHPFTTEDEHLSLDHLLECQFIPCCDRSPKVSHQIGNIIDCCLQKEQALRPTSIWLLESILLENLQKGNLLTYAKQWMSLENQEQKSRLLSQALKQKHSYLKQAIDQWLEKNNTPTQELIGLIREFQESFPQDESINAYLQRLTSLQPKKFPRFLGSIVLAILFLLSLRVNEDPLVEKRQEHPPAKEEVGKLNIIVRKDVSVFVDGKLIPSHQQRDYSITSGRHRVRFVKRGYKPIDETIQVSEGKVTTVRALEGGE